jgi:hypothetical protein
MRKFFTITIDVEPDCTTTWHYSNPLTFRGVTKGIVERLQPLFNKYDACPTYLINNVVLEDKQSTETFLNLQGRYELATHLHCEFIEPQKEFDNYAGQKGEGNQCFLEPQVEFEKMKSITKLFENNFNRKATSFRAGRFSAGSNTIKSLKELGYKVDTSVTPHVKWNDKTRARAVDYTNAKEQPYFIKDNSYPEEDPNGTILEVPVSIISTTKFFRKRELWLRPSFYREYGPIAKVVNAYSKKFGNENIQVFNMMFHPVEVLPGLSPYTKTEADCKVYMNLLETFLQWCGANNIRGVGLSDLYDIYRQG